MIEAADQTAQRVSAREALPHGLPALQTHGQHGLVAAVQGGLASPRGQRRLPKALLLELLMGGVLAARLCLCRVLVQLQGPLHGESQGGSLDACLAVVPEEANHEGQREEHEEGPAVVGGADSQVAEEGHHACQQHHHGSVEHRVPHKTPRLGEVYVHVEQLVLVHQVGQGEEQSAQGGQDRRDAAVGPQDHQHHHEVGVDPAVEHGGVGEAACSELPTGAFVFVHPGGHGLYLQQREHSEHLDGHCREGLDYHQVGEVDAEGGNRGTQYVEDAQRVGEYLP
mmetsp:Transcript_16831/g.37361  ORF Transcript_16831/g.37361 Transcript_16831/m.37361 type:complete len:282 (-) Transcript_16831:725-1570(-)